MLLKKRGQAAVTDLFIALAVFIILITITTLTWNLYNIRLSSRFDYDDMMLKGFQVSDLLVKSKGVPVDWENIYNQSNGASTPLIIGLADNERFLSKSKVNQFKMMSDDSKLNNDIVKNTLKINLYNYYFVIRNQSTGAPVLSTGLFPSGKYAVNLARIIMYDEGTGVSPHIMEFAIWK